MAKGTINTVMLLGRLGADPDVRYTNSGTPVAKLSLATVDSVKSGDNYEDRTEWHKVVVWGKQAEFLGQYAEKGKLLYVRGSLRTSKWEDNSGSTRYTTEVIAQEVQLVGGKSNGDEPSKASGSPPKQGGSGGGGGKKQAPKSSGGFDDSMLTGNFNPEDDIPF